MTNAEFNLSLIFDKRIKGRLLVFKYLSVDKILFFCNSSKIIFPLFLFCLDELLTWIFFSPLLTRNNRCTIRFKIGRTVSYRISVDLFWERFPACFPTSKYSSPLLTFFCAWLVHVSWNINKWNQFMSWFSLFPLFWLGLEESDGTFEMF